MKKLSPHFPSALAIMIMLVINTPLSAQGPPAPPANGHNQSTNQQPGSSGGSAPIGSGLAILLTMGAGYAVFKVRKNKE